MRERNKYWVYGRVIFGALLGVSAFYVVPKWRQALNPRYEPPAFVFSGMILGVVSVLVVPMALSLVLPAPVKWFRQEIIDIAESREREALERLKRFAD